MFENQPKGLYALALANTGERFGYYTMLAIFVLFLQSNFGWGEGLAGTVYATFLMLVYFLPIVGGAVADWIWTLCNLRHYRDVHRISVACRPSRRRGCRNSHHVACIDTH